MKTPLVITRATTSPSIEAAFASRFHTPNQSSSRRSMDYKPGVFFGRQDDLAHYEKSAREYGQRQEGIPTVIRMTITPENFSFAAGVLTQPYNAGEGNRYGYMAFNTYQQMEQFDATVMAARPDYTINLSHMTPEAFIALGLQVGFYNAATDSFDYYSYNELKTKIEGQRPQKER